MATYETVIGLEVHLQLNTETKLFCGCPTRFGAEPNSHTCPVCLGLPGVLPVFNERAYEWGIRVALAFNCEIAPRMKFDRKQYFYPDLPKGYQISQFDQPLARAGFLDIVDSEGNPKRIRIHRMHLEEDAGKSLHENHESYSLVDYNRAGIPLIEMVSEPDMRSADEAYQYLTELKSAIQYLGVSTCNMEEGSLRCDTNISIRPEGQEALGNKVEIKNLNSFRAVKLALEFERQRQESLAEQGIRIPQETRLWDEKRQITDSMRSKEEASDYRYFPEPDLVPFTVEAAVVEQARKALPELPSEKRERFQKEYGLSAYDAGVLTQQRSMAEFFEASVKSHGDAKSIANWLMGDVSAYLNANGLEIENIPVRPEWLGQMVALIEKGTITGKIAKAVLTKMLETGKDPQAIVEEEGLQQIGDADSLAQVAEEVIGANPKVVEEYRSGKESAIMYLVGQGMKKTKGRANPKQLTDALKEKLG